MERKVWKYVLPRQFDQVKRYPLRTGYKLSRFLHIGIDPNGDPCMWAEIERIGIDVSPIDENTPPEKSAVDYFEIICIPTGEPIPERFTEYLGTMTGTRLVFHWWARR